METINLTAKHRSTVGNGPARALRRTGFTPAVLYGPQTEAVNLCVATSDMVKIVQRGSIAQMLLNLGIENGAATRKTAMIKELQTHPVTGEVLHVDFYEVAMDRKITVNIPVEIVGKSKGVEDGGILQIVRRELEVQCLPNQIPDVIHIDVTDVGIGDAVHVEQIQLAGEVDILAETNFTVVTVVSPAMEAEAETEEEAEGALETDGAEGSDAEEGA